MTASPDVRFRTRFAILCVMAMAVCLPDAPFLRAQPFASVSNPQSTFAADSAATVAAPLFPSADSVSLDADPGVVDPGVEAMRLIGASLRRFYEYRTVSASFRIEANLYGMTLAGNGEYLANWDARGLRFRYALWFPLSGERMARWVQCCDGYTLRTLTEVGGPATMRKVELEQIRNELSLEGQEIDARWPGLGGLPKMLYQLGRLVTWTGCEESAFGDVTVGDADSAAQPQTRRIWKLTGRISESAVRRFFSESIEGGGADGKTNRDEAISPARMAAVLQLPDYLVLCLDQETLFPCGIVLFHTDRRGKTTPIATLVTTRFLFGGRVDDAVFEDMPTDIESLDVTRAFLRSLRQGEVPD